MKRSELQHSSPCTGKEHDLRTSEPQQYIVGDWLQIKVHLETFGGVSQCDTSPVFSFSTGIITQPYFTFVF